MPSTNKSSLYLGRTSTYQWWMVFVLMLVTLVSFIDRQIISLVIEPMKSDLNLTDSQAGLLYSGFALFYAIAGIPLAWLIDLGNRKHILSVCLTLWTFFTMAGGVLHTFWWIFAARVGVGIGEASVTPAAHSIIGDIVPKITLPLAIAIFQSGAIVGTGLAFIFGGLVVSMVRHAEPVYIPLFGFIHAWQLSFFIVAAPGFLVLLLLQTIREPKRTGLDDTSQKIRSKGALRKFYRANWKTILTHHTGFACFVLMGHAFVFWTPSFFERAHGVPAETAAITYGLIFIIAGTIATLSSAKLAQNLLFKGSNDSLILIAIFGALGLILSIAFIPFANNSFTAFVLYIPAIFFLNVPFGLSFAALPLIAPAELRGRVAAIYMLTISAGTALGPPITGYLSDHIFITNDGLIHALRLVTGVFGLAGISILLFGKKHFAESIDKGHHLNHE